MRVLNFKRFVYSLCHKVSIIYKLERWTKFVYSASNLILNDKESNTCKRINNKSETLKRILDICFFFLVIIVVNRELHGWVKSQMNPFELNSNEWVTTTQWNEWVWVSTCHISTNT